MKQIHFLSLATLLLIGCGKHAEQDTSSSGDTAVVAVTNVLSLQPSKTVILPGELYPWNKVNIYSKVKGFVKTLPVDRGAHVKKGQVLAVLDAPEILAEFDQARGQLRAAEANYNQSKVKADLSKLAYDRLISVSKTKGAVSIHELDQSRTQLLSDSAALASAEGNLNAARSHYRTKEEFVNYLTITAPFDGTITERNISPGALISATETTHPMFVLEDVTTLRLTVPIPELYANALRKDTSVEFTVSSAPGKKFKANFGRSSGSIVETNRVMLTEFDVKNISDELKAGMYAQVKFPVKRTVPTLFVPKRSVVSSSEKTFVISIKENKAEWINVKKGMDKDTLIEVFGNLQVNDPLVLDASEEIRDGQWVKGK